MAEEFDYSSIPKTQFTTPSQRGVTPAVTAPPPSSQPQAGAWNSPVLDSGVEMFNFTSAAPGVSLPSFASPSTSSNNFSDMALSQASSQFASRGSLQSTLAQAPRDSHDSKRIKVESPPSALDSMDSWLKFDDDMDKFGSFEIDYSKHFGSANRLRQTTDMTPGLGSGLYANPTAPFREEDFFDDSAFDHSLSDDEDLFESMNLDEQLSKMNSLTTTDPPVSKSIYSTPSNWDKPQPIFPTSTAASSSEVPRGMGSDVWDNLQQGSNYILSPDERRRLLEIAMGPSRGPSYVTPGRFNMGYGAAMQPSSSQEFGPGMDPRHVMSHVEPSQRRSSTVTSTTASGTPQTNNTRELRHKQSKNDAPADKPTPPKRSSTSTQPETASGTKEKTKSADRVAHNDVERKYRTNLKDKITELRNAVPALQQTGDGDDPDSAQGAAKVSKGTVLTKATEYIQQLEQRNQDILKEHQQLLRRLQAFEALANSSMARGDMMPSHSMTLFDPRGFC